MLELGRIAVHRSRFPVTHSPNSARQGSGQSLGRLPGTAHGELDLLVDLTGQTPGLILRPHQVRFLRAFRRPAPGQCWCVAECVDRAGEQQHYPIWNLHSRRLRDRDPARPALPYGRIPLRGRRRVRAESRERCLDGIDRCFARRVAGIRPGIVEKGDTHIHVEAWWAVPNKIPPVNISSQQPARCVGLCSGPYLRHPHQSGATTHR